MPLSRRIVVGVLAGTVTLAIGWVTVQHRARTAAAGQPTSIDWPGPAASLRDLPVVFPPAFGSRRVYLDAGHGAAGNTGNVSSFCVPEEAFTLALAEAVRDRLEMLGHFEVRISRDGDERVAYPDRLRDAAAWGADALVSIHSDVRGRETRWSPEGGDKSCPLSLEAPGYAVLVSDEGDAEHVRPRFRLARAFARALDAAGLPAYGGAEYEGLYEADPRARGVFIDRHAMEKRIYVLRNAEMPSVLVETHNAWDAREAARWGEPQTLDSFSSALARALVEALSPE